MKTESLNYLFFKDAIETYSSLWPRFRSQFRTNFGSNFGTCLKKQGLELNPTLGPKSGCKIGSENRATNWNTFQLQLSKIKVAKPTNANPTPPRQTEHLVMLATFSPTCSPPCMIWLATDNRCYKPHPTPPLTPKHLKPQKTETRRL